CPIIGVRERNSAPSLVSVGRKVPYHRCQCGRRIVPHHWCQWEE
ncbi:unnamed protein product, partial [Staurois parvus]